jgi:MerR family redox-sensitive transcriptional activator SoxR
VQDLSIGEVARLTSLRPSTLRFYEESGILPRARRVNGRRVYGADLVDLIKVARFAQGVGFTLSEIRALMGGLDGGRKLRAQWRPLAKAKLRELDAVIDKARRMKAAIEYGLECGCIRIEDCLPARVGRSEAHGQRAPKQAVVGIRQRS